MATHSNILAWRMPWTEEPDKLWSIWLFVTLWTIACQGPLSMGSQKAKTNWSNLAHRWNETQKSPFPSPNSLMTSEVKTTVKILVAVCSFTSTYVPCHTYTSIAFVHALAVPSLSCIQFCNPVDYSTSCFPILILHYLQEFAQTYVHWFDDAIKPSHPMLLLYPPTLNFSQHQGLFQWVGSSHQVAKILKLKLQHQSFQWIFRVDFN